LNKVVKFSPNYGNLMENVVFLELLRKTNTHPLMETFYYKSDGEVDKLDIENKKIILMPLWKWLLKR